MDVMIMDSTTEIDSGAGVQYITTHKEKENIIWGPQAKNVPLPGEKKSSGDSSSQYKGKYPTIGVKYKTYLGKPGSGGKYGKKLSSRGVRVAYINITPIIIREANKNGISPLLLKAVIQTESGYNNYARGVSGPLGLCQLMPGTARRLGVKDPFNPEQNIAGGAKLLGMLVRQFGSIDRALAAYNLGGGAVARHGGVPASARGFVRLVKSRMKW